MSYQLRQDSTGQFRFRLKAANGEIVLNSESYTRKASALEGVDSVRANGTDADNYEHKTSNAGQPYFVLRAKNGQVVGTSEMYTSAAARDDGIASVQKHCGSPTVEDFS